MGQGQDATGDAQVETVGVLECWVFLDLWNNLLPIVVHPELELEPVGVEG